MSDSNDALPDDSRTPQPQVDESKNLEDLLLDWINTDTWNESEAILRANAEQLLSDEALKALDKLLAESAGKDGEDERIMLVLQRHRTILEQARAETIDAAYAELLKPSPLALALQALPDKLRDAIEALIAANRPSEVIEQVGQHPILLTQEATDALDKLLNELQKAGRDDAVSHIKARYVTLKQVIEAQQDSLNAALNALINTAPVGEVRRIKQQREQAARSALPGTQDRSDYEEHEQVGIHASEGSVAAQEIHGNVSLTNVQPALDRQWQAPAQQALDKPFVGRQEEVSTLIDYLTASEDAAIIGRTQAMTLQGMAGIGKTYLARKLGCRTGQGLAASNGSGSPAGNFR